MKLGNYFMGYHMPDYVEGSGAVAKLADMVKDKGISNVLVVTDKTLLDFKNLDASVDYSTTVFVLKATVVFTETPFYTSCHLTAAGVDKITLYCSSAKQYGFLKQFAGQEVTIELAACNWNNKTFWAGCVLSVITEDGKIINSLNFHNN
jgi:hypothetical protein